MTEKAQRCIAFVLAREGGYVDHPADRGGPTNFGISSRSYPDLDIKNLTREQAEAIYEKDYWTPAGCELYDEPLALAVMDYAVNSSVRRAVRELALVLGLPRDANPNAIAGALEAVPSQYVVAEMLVVERAAWLVRRALSVPGQDVFAVGWVKRLIELKRAVEAAHGGENE